MYHITLLLSLLLQNINKGALSIFTEDEFDIVSDVTEELNIRHCIIFQKTANFYDIKKFSSKNLLTRLMNDWDDLDVFIEEKYRQRYETATNDNILIILKDEDLSEILTKYHIDYFNDQMAEVKWLAFVNDPSLIIDENYRLPVNYKCEFIIVQPKNLTTYILTEVYEVKGKTFLYDFGSWNRHQGLMNTPNTSFDARRLNLKGTELVVSVDNKCFYGETFSVRLCIVMELIEDLSNVMDFKIVEEPTDNPVLFVSGFGRGEIAGGGYVWLDDIGIVTKIGPIFKSTYNWYIKYATTKLKTDYYLRPFKIDFWLALLISVIVGTTSILVVEILLKKLTCNEKRSVKIGDLYVGLGILCNQNEGEVSENAPIRILSISLRVIAMFSIASYGAVIVSFLAVEIPEVPFSNLQEFFQAKDYRLIIYFYNLMNMALEGRMTEDDYQKLYGNYSTLVVDDDLASFEPYLQDVCEGKSAIALFNNDIFQLSPPCDLLKIEEPLCYNNIYLVIQYSCPFDKIFNQILMRFRESGVLKRMQNQIDNVPVQYMEEDSFYPVEMEQMVQVLFIPILGIALSIVFFVLEWIYVGLKREIKT